VRGGGDSVGEAAGVGAGGGAGEALCAGGGDGDGETAASEHAGTDSSPQKTRDVHQADPQQPRPAGQSEEVAHGIHVAVLPFAYSEGKVWQ